MLFKIKTRLDSNFNFKDWILKNHTSGAAYKFQCESYCGECLRRLKIIIGEHIGIYPLTKKLVKPNNSRSFSILQPVSIL